jgi:hypothetical protein
MRVQSIARTFEAGARPTFSSRSDEATSGLLMCWPISRSEPQARRYPLGAPACRPERWFAFAATAACSRSVQAQWHLRNWCMSAAARHRRLPDQEPSRSPPVRSHARWRCERGAGTCSAILPSHATNPGADAKAPAEKRRWRHDTTTSALETNLSGDMEITREEIEAIARLLGDDFKTFLSEH